MNFPKWFFTFTRRERLGILLLLILFLSTFTVMVFLDRFGTNRAWNIDSYAFVRHHPTRDTLVRITEINRMGVEDWRALGGINYSQILTLLIYRQALGGFYDVRQIAEVVEVADTTLLRFRAQTTCDISMIRTIPVDSAHLNDLSNHPYLSKDFAKLLLLLHTKYQRKERIFESLKSVAPTSKIEQVRRYVSFR